MNNKIIIAIVVLVLLVGGAFAATRMMSGGNEPEEPVAEAVATPTPVEKLKEANESVEADLSINAARTAVVISLIGLEGRYEGISYELRYASDNGEKGAVGGLRTPIALDEDADDFERNVELGTCSTGGKCRYDQGVKDFSLTIKLHTTSGEVEVLQETFDEL